MQSPPPKSSSRAIASPAVGGNQQSLGRRVSLLSHPFPPSIDCRDGKLGRVMTDANRNARFVQCNVINSIGNCLAEFRVWLKYWSGMGCNLRRIALGAVSLPRVFHVSQRFFLLCINRDCRLSRPGKRTNAFVDVFKLGVTVRMLLAFDRLAVGL